jgi:DNA repair protein RadA/Sms
VDTGRVNMLCAVLTRRVGLALGNQDVYVNVTGGVRVEEPAADLGVALAIASALRDRPVGKGTACFGEVGLTGDLRFVSGASRRTSEMIKLGFGRIIRPEGTSDGPPTEMAGGRIGRGASVVEVSTLEEAVAVALL